MARKRLVLYIYDYQNELIRKIAQEDNVSLSEIARRAFEFYWGLVRADSIIRERYPAIAIDIAGISLADLEEYRPEEWKRKGSNRLVVHLTLRLAEPLTSYRDLSAWFRDAVLDLYLHLVLGIVPL